VVGEKRDAQWSDTGVCGYMPLLGFLCETPLCLVDEFREGNVSPGAGQLEFYRQCRARMPVGKRLARYRADRASYQAALINELEADQVRWAITADQDAAVKAVMAGAHAVQLVSALLQHGPEHLKTVREEMGRWMEEHEYHSLRQMQGSMNLTRCPDPQAFERANYMRILQSWHP